MLTISKPLSSSQAQAYHKLEFTAETASYYKQDGAVQGEWQGQLAQKFGLEGAVDAETFALLSEGKNPQTAEQMVKHRTAQEYVNADGGITKAVEHRAGWDATFSAPKSVSLTALVGGDDRVREAHRAAVTTALSELERYTQARIGGNNPAETTGKFISAKFEHDTARPVDGYAAPQLHTHAVVFNVTERADGTTRAVQPQSFFDSQSYATAVYQSALTHQLRKLGYEIDAGRSGAPEIKGYSQEYLDASSLRSQQIRDHLEKSGRNGPAAAQIAAHATRDTKQILTPQEVLAAHREIASEHGNQAEKVIAAARDRAQVQGQLPDQKAMAREAVTYAKSGNFEREAVADERILMRDALRRGMGETTFADIRAEFNARHQRGDLQQLSATKHATGRTFTTPETVAMERANVAHVMGGQNKIDAMMTADQAKAQADTRTFLNDAQRRAIQEVLTSPDRIHGLQGLAGTGKTTTLVSIREGAEKSGYAVEGFAPTSRAAGQLRDAGISATTLQRFIVRGGQDQTAGDPANRHLYMLDESSLASTQQMRAFLKKIQPQDRVLVIGDTRQHQGVDAGRPFEQMQDAGMRTSQLDRIMRQKDPELLKAVELLARNETAAGVKMLSEQGRVTEISTPKERIEAIAKDYAANPENTLVVSPDNRSRQQINQAIRVEMQANGTLASDNREFRTLTHRSDMTGPDRAWAVRYQPDNIVRYTTGSKELGIERGSTVTVLSTDARSNTVTVQREDGQTVTYDPKRLRGVNVFQATQREFATGDRIQFTDSNKDLSIARRDLGIITNLEAHQVTVRLDGKEQRTITFNPAKLQTFDHGYAVTSHSSQGLTAGRVIANIDTDSARDLINTRLAYVAVSRAADDVRIYTNNAETLGARLATENNKTSAVNFRPISSAEQLRAAVEMLRTNETAKGVELLAQQGRIREYADPNHRIAAVVSDYAGQPGRTVIIAPDRAERQELNPLIRAELKSNGSLAAEDKKLWVHTNVTEGRLTAANYEREDVITYKQAIKQHGLDAGASVVVTGVDARRNLLTVQKPDGEEVTYNPARFRAETGKASVQRDERREFATGELVQFTASDKGLGVKTGDFGIIENIAANRAISIRLDAGKTVELNASTPRSIDYGYTVDGFRSFAADRLLVSVENAPKLTSDSKLLNALSRATQDAAIYTSDARALSQTPFVPPPTQIEQLRQAVFNLRNNDTEKGVTQLAQQGRIHEAADPKERATALTRNYAANPDGAIVVAYEPTERDRLTSAIRAELKREGIVAEQNSALSVLRPRSDQSEYGRTMAETYQPGDVIRYRFSQEELGIEKNSTAQVVSVDPSSNRLTVELPNGREATYNPEKTRGLTATSTVFHQTVSDFAEGDRIRFTGSDRDLGVRRNDFGTIEKIGEAKDLIVRSDAGKRIEIAPATPRQFEQGYVVSNLKGMSPDRVLVSEEHTERLGPFSEAYKAISRASQDIAIYTPNQTALYDPQNRPVSPAKAVENAPPDPGTSQKIDLPSVPSKPPQFDRSLSLGM